MPKYERTCEVCKKEYISKREWSKYCSNTCKNASLAKRLRENYRLKVVELTKTCPYCKKEFKTSNKKKKYCNHGCASAMKRDEDKAQRKFKRENPHLFKEDAIDRDKCEVVIYSIDNEFIDKKCEMFYKWQFAWERGKAKKLIKSVEDSTLSVKALNHYWRTGAIEVYKEKTHA